MRCITTANGYLRSVVFGAGQISADQKANLAKIALYILSVYVPSFFETHLNPATTEGSAINFFQSSSGWK